MALSLHEPSDHIQAKRQHRDIVNQLRLLTTFKQIPNSHTIVNTRVQPPLLVGFVLINIRHSNQWCLNRQGVKPLDVMLNLCFFASTWLFCLLIFLITYTPERYLIPLRSVRITWDVKNIAVTSHALSHPLF
jgi:hypothetical protein